ncbi:MAG: imidazolonepropionase [Acidobacteria bacterium]|nr:imidazolonepropionase [Acidobacteriota bacterium]
MTKVDLIIHNAGQLVTCASDGKPKRGAAMQDVGTISNGAVAIKHGKFVGVGKSKQILAKFEAEQTIDAERRVVCPGFVDPHTHIVYAGDRLNEFELKIKGAEYLDILAGGGGIISTVVRTRKASIANLVKQARGRLEKMLACGTTACEIKTGYGLDTNTELKMLRVIGELENSHPMDIVPTFLAAHTVPPEFKGNTEGYVDLICEEMLPAAADWYSIFFLQKNMRRLFHDLQRADSSRIWGCAGILEGPSEPPVMDFFVDVFTEKNAFDRGQMGRILSRAKALGFKLKAHVDQFTNLGGSRLAIRSGAVSIDHLDAISRSEIKELAASETIGVVIPTENFNAGKTKFAPARKLVDAGCAIALSTDYNPGSAPCPSQPMAMAISCRYQKLLPSEAFNAVTINAAYAIGLGDTHGSIEVGKKADLLVADVSDYRQLAYEFGGNLITKVIKSGEAL